MAYGANNPEPSASTDKHSSDMTNPTEQDRDFTVTVPKEILGGHEFKEGEEVVLKIKGFMGDMVQLSYAPPKDQESPEEMSPEQMNDPKMMDSMKSMPTDMMRKKLPKANRENY